MPEQPNPNPAKTGEQQAGFWIFLERLLDNSQILIDRPKGSAHPDYPDQVYPLDYGSLGGTTGGDGEAVDVWVGSGAVTSLDAVVLAVDLAKRDVEVKLLVGCSDEEKRQALGFLNDGLMQAILVERKPGWLHSRRSIRRFLPHLVEPEVVERVLEAAIQAPSAHNRQPWRFVVVGSMAARNRLAERMGEDFLRDLLADGIDRVEASAQVARSRQRILEAPVVIVACLERIVGDIYPDNDRQQAEFLMGVQGVAMAGQNLLLAAHAEGLGGVWMCAPLFAEKTVQLALELPDTWQPLGMILLGHPEVIPPRRARRPLAEVVRFV